ncbi:hypothetical protein BDW75DRAFT_244449 [Aspergillus navahoensis]
MAHPLSITGSARSHEQTQIRKYGPFTFQQGPGVPGPFHISAFPTIPQGIYSSLSAGCDGVNNPVPTGNVEENGHSYFHCAPLLRSLAQPSSDDSPNCPNDRKGLADPSAWFTDTTPLDQPLQELAGPVSSPSNDGGSGQQRLARVINTQSPEYALFHQAVHIPS